MGFNDLYCGNINFVPFPLSYTEKLRVPYLEASSKNRNSTNDNFSNVYADARNILLDLERSKGQPCAFTYKFFKGYNSKAEDEIKISVSTTGGMVKQKIKEEETTLFSFFNNNEFTVNQVECYQNKKFPTASFSATLNETAIFIDNDTLNVNIIEGQNQLLLLDTKKRPLKAWFYDTQNRLTQFRLYEYNELGLLRIDSTNIHWTDNKVKRINYGTYSTVCTYEPDGNISKIENYNNKQLLNVFEYKYTYDLKGNWLTYDLQEFDPKKNNRSRKYFVQREIVYR